MDTVLVLSKMGSWTTFSNRGSRIQEPVKFCCVPRMPPNIQFCSVLGLALHSTHLNIKGVFGLKENILSYKIFQLKMFSCKIHGFLTYFLCTIFSSVLLSQKYLCVI